MDWMLTDVEINRVIHIYLLSIGNPDPTKRLDLYVEASKAQARKLVEWLDEPDICLDSLYPRRYCEGCWQQLKKELE